MDNKSNDQLTHYNRRSHGNSPTNINDPDSSMSGNTSAGHRQFSRCEFLAMPGQIQELLNQVPALTVLSSTLQSPRDLLPWLKKRLRRVQWQQANHDSSLNAIKKDIAKLQEQSPAHDPGYDFQEDVVQCLERLETETSDAH